MALPCRHVEFFSTGKKPVETEAVCSTNWATKRTVSLSLRRWLSATTSPWRWSWAVRLTLLEPWLPQAFHTSCSICSQHNDHSVGDYCQPWSMKCKCTIKLLKKFHWKLVCCKEFGFLLQWSTFVWNIYWDPLLIWKPLITRLYFISLPLSA